MYVNIYNLYMQTAKHSNKHTHAYGHNNTFLFTYKYIVVFIQKLKRRLHNKTVLLTNIYRLIQISLPMGTIKQFCELIDIPLHSNRINMRRKVAKISHKKRPPLRGSLFLTSSVTRLGNLLQFGQLFKACGNNYFAQIAHILVKVSKIFHFYSEIFFGQLFETFVNFLLVSLLTRYSFFLCTSEQ